VNEETLRQALILVSCLALLVIGVLITFRL